MYLPIATIQLQRQYCCLHIRIVEFLGNNSTVQYCQCRHNENNKKKKKLLSPHKVNSNNLQQTSSGCYGYVNHIHIKVI